VAREFGLNQAQAGLLATVGLVGAFLGALFWGTISDLSLLKTPKVKEILAFLRHLEF
jgi:MFS family permease